jgi:2-polyprenyl-6-methoxyphenol hydroxylase-like FAD-dependent oxidoreductase
MLAKAGSEAVLIDPHVTYPDDFRCEKLDQSQLALLDQTGVGEALLAAATPSDELWVARYGRVVEKRPNHQVGALYDTMVNAMRGAIGGSVTTVVGKCTGLVTSAERQVVTLAGGDEVSARLVIMANGLNSALRRNMGFEREDISPAHSISVGFHVAPVGRSRFDFSALTYYPERLDQRIAYLWLFPLGAGTRANLFVYRDMRDPWLKALREAPVRTLTQALPGLAALTGEFAIPGFVNVRPADLYVTRGVEQAGVVLVGDACGTSCPAAGTGTNKVLTDVMRLVNHHIPEWLATPGMGLDKVQSYYADPVKTANDQWALDRAFYVRALSTEGGLAWAARRRVRYIGQAGVGALRSIRSRLNRRLAAPVGTPSRP